MGAARQSEKRKMKKNNRATIKFGVTDAKRSKGGMKVSSGIKAGQRYIKTKGEIPE